MKTLSSNFKKLTALLNDQQFHSGIQLGQQLNISRNAIWKMIHQLTEFGISIESSKKNGYKLCQPLILLDTNSIKFYLEKNTQKKIEEIFILSSIGSTNDYLKSINFQHPNKIQICLSEHQSLGKGRMGRTWESPFGANIYLSFRFKTHKDISQLSGLSLAIGLNLIQTLKTHLQINTLMMKWPNDIYCHHEKIGGILIEIQAESHGSTDIIVGIGLNVNQHSESNRLCLEKILNQYQDRNFLAALMIKAVFRSLEKFNEFGLSDTIKNYQTHDYLYNKSIHLTVHQQKTITGIAKGINPLGHLCVEDKNGKLTAYSAGDASLHKDS